MNISKVERQLVYVLGVLCTMNGIQIGGFAIYNYVLFGWIIYRIANCEMKITLTRGNMATSFCLLFSVSIILSIVCSMNVLPTVWITNSIKTAVKFIVLVFFIFWIYPQTDMLELREVFFRGLKLSAQINLVWGYTQMILYIMVGININKIIFGNLLNMTEYGWEKYISGGQIRLTGLGWEPANFALIMLIGYILCRKYQQAPYVKLLYVGAILLSTSKSAYLAIACVWVAEVLLLFQLERRIMVKKVMISLATLVGVMVVVVCCWRLIQARVFPVLNSLSNMFGIYMVDKRASSSIHISYYANLLELLKGMPIKNIIFGNGFCSTGYLYSMKFTYLQSRITLMGWNPESDLVTLIVGNGIVGTFIYYYYLLRCLIVHYKDEYGLMVIAILAEGVTYLLIRGSWSILLLLFIFVDIRNDEKKHTISIFSTVGKTDLWDCVK